MSTEGTEKGFRQAQASLLLWWWMKVKRQYVVTEAWDWVTRRENGVQRKVSRVWSDLSVRHLESDVQPEASADVQQPLLQRTLEFSNRFGVCYSRPI